MNPNVNDMLCFLAVVETRSFSAAATQMRKTRSAISQSVARLENDLGARLLYRTTRALALTEAGTRFVGHCAEMKRVYQEAIAQMQDGGAEQHGSIVLTAPHALCDSDLIPALSAFSETYPNLNVRVIADDARLDLVDEQVDLALRVGDLTGQTARVSRIGNMRESLYASAGYVTGRNGVPEDSSDLEAWDHIANEWQGTRVTYQFAPDTILRVKPRYRFNSFHQLRSAVCASLGVARLPDRTVSDLVRNGTLVRLKDLGAAPVFAVHYFDKRAPSWVRVIVGILRQQMKDGQASAP